MTTCTKYYCNHCGKELQDEELKEIQLGKRQSVDPPVRGWGIGLIHIGKKPKIINTWQMINFGDLCLGCFIDLKRITREWKKKGMEVKC